MPRLHDARVVGQHDADCHRTPAPLGTGGHAGRGRHLPRRAGQHPGLSARPQRGGAYDRHESDVRRAGHGARFEQVRRGTVVAVNLGGCVVPLALVVVQVAHIVATGGWVLVAAAGITAANVIACWRLAQPVPGIGIRMPALVSALVAVGGTWILLGAADLELYRAPVAFTAGVLGPLVGADLMHLGDLSKVSVGMLSIGGAGTFDGIVLSGVLAALVA
ncbi:MAG: DUF1614 domain-containing protein [Pirellulales bacterium]